MNRNELIDQIATRCGLKKADAKNAVTAFETVIGEELAAGREVELRGFGVFSAPQQASRKGINPKTKDPIDIPSRRRPRFKAGAVLKRAVDGK